MMSPDLRPTLGSTWQRKTEQDTGVIVYLGMVASGSHSTQSRNAVSGHMIPCLIFLRMTILNQVF